MLVNFSFRFMQFLLKNNKDHFVLGNDIVKRKRSLIDNDIAYLETIFVSALFLAHLTIPLEIKLG